MMMVQDSTHDRPKLSPESIALLESALQKYLVDQTQVESLKPALRQVASEARDKKLHAEHLLLVLKDVWFALPQIRTAPDGEAQQKLLQRVVTLCIREYYST